METKTENKAALDFSGSPEELKEKAVKSLIYAEALLNSHLGFHLNADQLTEIALSNFSIAKLILNSNRGNELNGEQLTRIATSNPHYDWANNAENAQIILNKYLSVLDTEKLTKIAISHPRSAQTILENHVDNLNPEQLTQIALSDFSIAKLILNSNLGNELNGEQLTRIATSNPHYDWANNAENAQIILNKYLSVLDTEKLTKIARSHPRSAQTILEKHVDSLNPEQLTEIALSYIESARVILNNPELAKLIENRDLNKIKNAYINQDIYNPEKLIESVRTENPDFDFIKIIILFSKTEQITNFKNGGGNALEHIAARGSITSNKNGLTKKYQEILELLIKKGVDVNKGYMMEWVNSIQNDNREKVIKIISKTPSSPAPLLLDPRPMLSGFNNLSNIENAMKVSSFQKTEFKAR
ncbi:MAG TPA: hypothetical protein VNK03_01080 [Gammaproteobacteria bacterium]|nr:hypothetical protein [Gammaproteobacteria bacterium]